MSTNIDTAPYVGKHYRHWQLGWAVYQIIDGHVITVAVFETRSEARAHHDNFHAPPAP